MTYDIKPVETYYHGQHFKSILEAKWACFFDICEWKWTYEPFKVNNRIPDFILKGFNIEVIAEVKPEIFIDEKFIKSIELNYKNWKGDILILTDKPFEIKDYRILLGYGFDNWCNSDLTEFFMKSVNDFSSNTYNWDGVMKEETNRKNFLQFNMDSIEIENIKHNWQKAGVITKFSSY